MGQNSSSIQPAQASFIFDSTSLHNVTLFSKELGIKYKITSTGRFFRFSYITTITRQGPQDREPVEVAFWKRRIFRRDQLNMRTKGLFDEPQDHGFVSMKKAFPKARGFRGRGKRIFVASNPPQQFTWKMRGRKIKLYSESEDGTTLIAALLPSTAVLFSNLPELFLYQNCPEMIDIIVVTCFIQEGERRSSSNSGSAASAGAGAASCGGGGC